MTPLPRLQAERIPIPLAHFPLTGGFLGSLLLPSYGGDTYGNQGGPNWVNDTKFGSVVSCNDVSGVHGSSIREVPSGQTGVGLCGAVP